MEISESEIYAIERPHRRLLWLYIMRSILSGPLIVITLPVLLFRYETMRYRFDDEGIHMRWGLLFRRQVNLTYARIQDIHLTSGILQRWLGLGDIKVQTASGSSDAEVAIEGMMEFEAIRDFLYTRMRGYRRKALAAATRSSDAARPETEQLLKEIVAEMRGVRAALERLAPDAGTEGDRRDV
jgi:putative membrane protein